MELQKINTLNSLPETGHKSYDAAIRAFNKAVTGPITAETVIDYLKEIKNCKPATLNHKIYSLKKSLMQIAEKSGADSTEIKYKINAIFKNPELKTAKIDRSITPEDVLTKSEIESIIKTATEKTALVIETLAMTALRISELISIKLSDCKKSKDGEAIEITFIGKGRKQRTVFITPDLFNRINKEYNGKTLLFESKSGKALNRSNLFTQIKKASEAAGIFGVHPHAFRHTWATANIDRLGIDKVSKFLGHSSIAITSEYYLHGKATAAEILNY